jgi:hypothetical protein
MNEDKDNVEDPQEKMTDEGQNGEGAEEEISKDDQEIAEETPKPPGILQNYISFAGMAVAFASLASIILLFMIEFTSTTENAYLGIMTYVILPGVLIFGLLVTFLGALYERRRRRKLTPEQIAEFPILDLNNPTRRRQFLVFLTGSFLFFFVSAFGSYRAYEYSESVVFCGETCHTVMKPEFLAYGVAPHAQVKCVECHVGGGAEWYVKAKLNGVRQLYGVATGHYSKPIKAPHNMRDANETCARCHWNEKFHGDKLRVFNYFGYDEENTQRQVRMLVKVGGGVPGNGEASGIHWHMNLENEITYFATDEDRQNIPWVQMKDPDGKITVYTAKEANLTARQINETPKRKMNCIDCHNRPTHIFLSPDKAVNKSLVTNKIDRSLPFVKAKAVEVLSKQYKTENEALDSISTGLEQYYKTQHADLYESKKDSINRMITEVKRIYRTYFFPEMKTDWRVHPNNVGHFNTQGCFRCHDGKHFSNTGKVIRNECTICHTTLDQKFGGKTIIPEDGKFQHPVDLGEKSNQNCAACHRGDRSFKHPLNLGDISKFQCADCHKGNKFKEF